jgi:hypothetical protein
MFFKSDDTHYSYKDIQTVLEKECSDILVKPKQIKVLPKNQNNNKLSNIKVKPDIYKIKSQGWSHS